MKPEPIIVSIDGNIGAGKSTFVKKLKENFPNYHYIDEPVDLWTSIKNEDGESILQLYYGDKKRWSFTFQNYVLITRMTHTIKVIEDWKEQCKNDETQIKNNIFITERFIDTDFNIFSKMLHDDGFIDNMEWQIYLNWYKYLTNTYKLNYIVYLDISPEICKERIIKRSRIGEENISIDFLNKLDIYHQKWFVGLFIPIFKITCYEDFRVLNLFN
jgi:deoxyadenosine/deoxycytidine kinase